MIVCDVATAELMYAGSAWHTTKIVFAEESVGLGKQLASDGRRETAAVRADPRPDTADAELRPGLAFGTSSLPDPRPSKAARIQHALDRVEAAGSRAVGLLGLSFKGGTDELRDSPAVDLAEELFARGYDLRIFDRTVSTARLSGTKLGNIRERIPHLDRLLTDDLSAVLAHAETLVVTQCEIGNAAPVRRPRVGQVVIDLTELPHAQHKGFARYEGECR